jgi:hypothetical protein
MSPFRAQPDGGAAAPLTLTRALAAEHIEAGLTVHVAMDGCLATDSVGEFQIIIIIIRIIKCTYL